MAENAVPFTVPPVESTETRNGFRRRVGALVDLSNMPYINGEQRPSTSNGEQQPSTSEAEHRTSTSNPHAATSTRPSRRPRVGAGQDIDPVMDTAETSDHVLAFGTSLVGGPWTGRVEFLAVGVGATRASIPANFAPGVPFTHFRAENLVVSARFLSNVFASSLTTSSSKTSQLQAHNSKNWGTTDEISKR
ncbi:hypothetical protein HDV00_012465 [Rhizophlyctis rosea]|nr:hypothetical protein HDV00_012465 [Rhizophlyctis rosea]